MRWALFISLVIAIAGVAADTPQQAPKSPMALATIHKADAAQKVAQDAYDASMFKAKKTEVEELRAALKVATKKEDLDEANAIAATIKSIEQGMVQADSAAVAPNMIGRWKTPYQGRVITWTITPGAVRHSEDSGQPGIPQVQGHIMMVKWPGGATNRITFVDDRFFVEAWGPGRSINDPPDYVIAGVRDAQSK